MKARRGLLTLMAVLVTMALVLVGCGGGGSSSGSSGGSASTTGESTESTESTGEQLSIDVGTGTPIRPESSTPTIAFFTGGSHSPFLQAFNKGVSDEAKKLGISLTEYDANFEPTVQFNQVQDALQAGKANAFIASPLDANQMCPVLTKQAPAANVAVFISLLPVCGTDLEPEGEKLWVPGTVTTVADNDSVDNNIAWIEEIAKRLPGKHTIAVLLGPPLIGPTLATKQAIEKLAPKYPELEFKYEIYTDQTTPDSLAKTQTLLQAHPETDVILSIYSDETVGAALAIKSASKEGQVKLFDQGGSEQSAELIKSGELELTTVYVPYTYGVESVKAVAETFEGKKVPRYIGAFPKGGSIGHPVIIDSENVDSYEPQY